MGAARRRAVITGLGVVSPLGIGLHAFWASCVAGRSVVRRITAFDPATLTSQIAGEIEGFDPLDYMSQKQATRTERFMQLALAATQEAVEMSRVLGAVDAERLGVVLGNGGGGLGALETYSQVGAEKGWEETHPLALLKVLPDMAASNVAIRVRAKGPVMTLVAACVSSTQAIGQALRLIRLGEADAVVAVGTEAGVTRVGMSGFCLLHALSRRNDQPQRASRPFDADRDGFVLAEGSAALVIEELEHATARGATILAELRGYGQTSDAHHLVMPERSGEGAARCIEMALRDAGVESEDVDYISAHGTSTPLNDVAETRAVKAVFGDRADQVPMSSIKSMMGHALGAAGAIEAVAAVQTLRTGILPPTINLDQPDPQCDLDYVAHRARQESVGVVLKNSFGFGGQNASLVLAQL